MKMTSTRRGRTIAALAAGTLACGLLTVTSTAAHADPAPGANDVVGVGSDTVQYVLDFGADGDATSDPGYNSGKLGRLMSFDATPDANARAGYLNGSSTPVTVNGVTTGGLKPLNPTIVLRGGTTPVQRPNGSGAGIAALSVDTDGLISFARSSSALSQTQVTAAKNGGVGDLHEVRLAKDGIHIAAGTTTNAQPLSVEQLKNIYQCATGYTQWNSAAIGGTSSDTIIPIIPQNGSGTRKTFLTDIGFTVASDGSTTPALGSCVKTYEENDPYALYVDNSGNQVADPYALNAAPNPDAIEPISDGRLSLYKAGYFSNPNLPLGTTTSNTDQVTLKPQVTEITTGTPKTGTNTVYSDIRGLYVIFRQSDFTSTAHFNGGTSNWVNSLFVGSNAYFNTAAGQQLITAAGVTPDYADCGKNPTQASDCGAL